MKILILWLLCLASLFAQTTPVNTNLQLRGYLDGTGATATSPFVFNANPVGACGATPAYQWAVDATGQLHWCNPATLVWGVYPGAIGSQPITATGSAQFNPGTVADGALVVLGTITATGAVLGSTVGSNPQPALPAGVLDFEKVTAANVVTVYLVNLSGAPQAIPNTLFSVSVAGGGGIALPTSGTVSPGTAGQFAYYLVNGTVAVGHNLLAADIPALNYQAPIVFQAAGTPISSEATINFENSAPTNGLTLTFANPSAGNIQTGVNGLGPTNFTSTGLNEVCTITAGNYGCGYSINGGNGLWADSVNDIVIGVSTFPTTSTTGSYNVIVGNGNLSGGTTANHNTGVGSSALRGGTTCSYDVALGYNSGYCGTTTGNTAIGGTAMSAGTGSYNTAVGFSSLENVTGIDNNAVGVSALYLNGPGNYNSGMGEEALYDNYSGSYNTAIGNFAGAGNYSGSYNSFLGTLAGLSAGALPVSQTGTSNSTTTVTFTNTSGFTVGMNFFGPGVQAGTTISTVNANTSLVLSLATTTNGTNPYYGVVNGAVSGSNDTFLGSQSGQSSAAQQTYETVIGAGATAACSNCVSVGRQGTTANSSDVLVVNGLFTLSSGTGHPALPAASSAAQSCAWIADGAATPSYLRTETGGGTLMLLVCSNGTNWQDH